MITTLAALALLAADDDWNFKLSLGFDASGDAQTVTNFRVDIEGDQKTEDHAYETLLRIQYGESEGERIRNDVEARFRGDWKCGEDRWGLFSDTRFRIDEFQNFDTRLTESLGGTYQVYENEGEKKWNLDAVFGAGFRLDSGLTDPTADEFVPEGNIGFRGSMEPSERQTLKGSLFLYPDLDGLEDYRTFTNIDWNYMLDPDQGLSLRINADQEYDTARLVRSAWNVKVMVQVEL